MKQDIEMGMKRSASMAKLNSQKSSNNLSASVLAADGLTNGLNGLNGHGHGNGLSSSGENSPGSNAIAAVNGVTNSNGITGMNGNGNGVRYDAVKAVGGIHGVTSSGNGGGMSGTSALPFEPLNLTFQNVCYSVAVPKDTPAEDPRIAKEGAHAGQLQLLHDISGSFRPGVLTALMGQSGAGKTTLMVS